MTDRGATRRTGVGPVRRAGRVLLQILGLFVLLEPIWMLLPFAGFLYGSVLHVRWLARHPETAWLTHFVFPVLTLGWVGPALVLLGFGLFAVSAAQIYLAKIRRTGLVTGGLYRWLRHPQYLALALLGLGVLFTWGRALAYVAFVAMLVVYAVLARHEEGRCRRLFGDAYRRYARGTSALLPGDRRLRAIVDRWGWSGRVRTSVIVAVILIVGVGAFPLIRAVKRARLDVPFLTAVLEIGPAGPDSEAASGGVAYVRTGRLVVVRGPHPRARTAGVAERIRDALARLHAFSAGEGDEVAIVFVTPETPGDGPPDEPGFRPELREESRLRLLIFRCRLGPDATVAGAFRDEASRALLGGSVATVDLSRDEDEDAVVEDLSRLGPRFPAEERWRHLIDRQRAGRPAVSEGGGSTALVLVKAPILRTRLDPAFADEILSRMVTSPRFLSELADRGASADLIPVAFPRPGPGWYREHRDRPRVSLFVMLARPAGAGPASLFHGGGRELTAAFTAELDLSVEPASDAVGTIESIGPRRDLEERWEFFLSGL